MKFVWKLRWEMASATDYVRDGETMRKESALGVRVKMGWDWDNISEG